MFKLLESWSFWSAVLGVLSTLFAVWLSHFLTKRSAKFSLQMETIVRAIEVVSETLNKLDDIEDGILSKPLSYMSYIPTLEVSQMIHDSLTKELYLLAARANDKKLYALIYCAQFTVERVVRSGQRTLSTDGREEVADDIRYNLEQKLQDLHEKLVDRLESLPFHRKALCKYGKGCKLVSGIDKLTQADEMNKGMTK